VGHQERVDIQARLGRRDSQRRLVGQARLVSVAIQARLGHLGILERVERLEHLVTVERLGRQDSQRRLVAQVLLGSLGHQAKERLVTQAFQERLATQGLQGRLGIQAFQGRLVQVDILELAEHLVIRERAPTLEPAGSRVPLVFLVRQERLERKGRLEQRVRRDTRAYLASLVRAGSLEHLVRLERPGQRVHQGTQASRAFQGRLERAATPVRQRHLGSAVIQAIRERRE